MIYLRMKNILAAVLILFTAVSASAQDAPDEGESMTPVHANAMKGFHYGFYFGAYFANKHTALLYDGYGLDFNGSRNSFDNSIMRRKIIIEYGGANGQPDRIAEELKVNHDEWQFNETDMPVNMRYNAAFLLGLQLHYGFTKKEAVILNLNFAKLSVIGNFTITTNKPANTNQYYPAIRTYAITGSEQRFMLQAGYRKVLGDNDGFNIFIEGGLCTNYAKYLKNDIQIESLSIDLTNFVTQPGYNDYVPPVYTGFGFGGFAGIGANISFGKKTAQLVYNPSYEKYNIGEFPEGNLQHAVGLRVYF